MKAFKQFFTKNSAKEEEEELKTITTQAYSKSFDKDNKIFNADLFSIKIISKHNIDGNKNKFCIVNSEIFTNIEGVKNIKKFIIEVIGDEYLIAAADDPNLENIIHTVKVFKITEQHTKEQIISDKQQVNVINGFNLQKCINEYNSLSYENPIFTSSEELFDNNIANIASSLNNNLVGES